MFFCKMSRSQVGPKRTDPLGSNLLRSSAKHHINRKLIRTLVLIVLGIGEREGLELTTRNGNEDAMHVAHIDVDINFFRCYTSIRI